MPVRLIGREDVMACEKIQSIAFAYSLDLRELEGILSREPEPPDPYIGHFDGEGNLTACMELPEYKIRYEGGWARMTGIAGVASLPECRFGGAVRQLVQFAFQRMRQSGALFSALYPFSHAFYRQFGFGCASSRRNTRSRRKRWRRFAAWQACAWFSPALRWMR